MGLEGTATGMHLTPVYRKCTSLASAIFSGGCEYYELSETLISMASRQPHLVQQPKHVMIILIYYSDTEYSVAIQAELGSGV